MKNKWNKIITDSLTIGSGEIRRIIDSYDQNRIEKIISMILDESRNNILLTGAGTSGTAALKIVHSFRCQELPAFFISAEDALHGASGAVQERDLVFVISKGGESKSINKFAEIAKQRGAVVVGITNEKKSTLGQLSDEIMLLNVKQESDSLNLLATSSHLCVVSLFDAICRVIMVERGFSGESFLYIHPEGEVGSKLAHKNKRG